MKLKYILFIFLAHFIASKSLHAQVVETSNDSISHVSDTIPDAQDSIAINVPDTISPQPDSINTKTVDKSKVSDNAITQIVEYKAKDSIYFDLKTKMMYLHEEAEMNYGETNLQAAYVEVDFEKNDLFARGKKDSLDKEYGTPIFVDKKQSFKSKEMRYNIKTKKGLIREVMTQDGESYLHGSIVKKLPNDVTYIKDGKYTTCSHEHPHFEFRFFKAKVIPKEKIVTGPVYFVIEDVPTPVFLPFGLFPNKQGRQSGIIIPTYGESKRDGFFLQDGGYYWGVNDYIDMAFKGYISTRGSWKANVVSNYKKRYRFNGNFDVDYAITREGEKGLSDFSETKTFFIRWRHSQDPKARPNSTFSANVNAGSSKHKTLRPTNLNDFHNNTLESSVSYRTSWSQGKYNLTSSLRHKQNTNTHEVNLSLPDLSLSRSRIYPFRGLNKGAKKSILDDVSLSYNMEATNKLKAVDSTLFEPETLDDFRYGMKHTIPIKSSIKLFKYFNLTNSLTLNERWYPSQIERNWNNGPKIEDIDNDGILDTIQGYEYTDTVNKFSAAHDYSFNASISTKLYGMFAFKNGPVKALRHVMTPTIGYTYMPDFSDPKWGYYKNYVTDNYDPTNPFAEATKYSIFENGIYGSPPAAKTGSVNFSLGNNFEMKVKSNKDTTGMKKVKLIDNFTISTSYDLTKDSMQLSMIKMGGYTKLFKNIDVRFDGMFDPYVANIDSLGNKTRINMLEWEENKRLARFSSSNWRFGINYNIGSDKLKNWGQNSGEENADSTNVDNKEKKTNKYAIKWNVNLSYTFQTSTDYDAKGFDNYNKIVQNLSFSGDISPTPNWRIGYRSAYDFESKKIPYINLNLTRDLHCWEMLFTWVPIGYGGNTSYHFTIRLKAQMLKDVKYEIKKQPWDN